MTDILQWNLKGIKDKRSANYKQKVDIVTHLLSNPCKNGIINLQETHLDTLEQLPVEWTHFDHAYTIIPNFCLVSDTFAGTVLFLNKSIEIIGITVLVPGRVILVKSKHEGDLFRTNYISIYGKASGSSNEKRSIIRSILDQNLSVLDSNIFIGDYNFVTSPFDRNSNKLNSTDEACQSLWNELEIKLNLVDAFRVTNKIKRLYTFSSPTHSKSRIDRVYVPISVSGKILSTNYESTDVSDHKIVRTRFKSAIKKGPGCYIINKSLLEDPFL